MPPEQSRIIEHILYLEKYLKKIQKGLHGKCKSKF